MNDTTVRGGLVTVTLVLIAGGSGRLTIRQEGTLRLIPVRVDPETKIELKTVKYIRQLVNRHVEVSGQWHGRVLVAQTVREL